MVSFRRMLLVTGVAAACVVPPAAAAAAENPLVAPTGGRGPTLLGSAEAAAMKREAESLKRKAELLREAATSKYAEAAKLRKQAGGHRSDAAKRGEELRQQAEREVAASDDLADIFGSLTSLAPAGGMKGSQALAASMTGQMVQNQRAGDAQGLSAAQAQASSLQSAADRKATPLEQRADELENDGNRLMAAHNRLLGVSNARFLLLAADELARKVDADSRQVERLRSTQRSMLAQIPAR